MKKVESHLQEEAQKTHTHTHIMIRKTIRQMLLIATATIITLFLSTQLANSTSDQALSTTTATRQQNAQTTEQLQPTIEQRQIVQTPAIKSSTTGAKRQQVAENKSKLRSHQRNQTTQRPGVRPVGKTTAGSGSSEKQEDLFAMAQQQARLMMGYNNTPPLFVTDTRDFFVDVARQPLGTTLRTIKAMDMDGDPLEYSLQPANLHDASPYFTINPSTGELKLANRQFKFCINQMPLLASSQKRPTSTPKGADDSPASTVSGGKDSDNDDKIEDEEDDDDDEEEEEDDAKVDAANNDTCKFEEDELNGSQKRGLVGRNMYFLNVAVDDGRYTSVVEFQIHVVNSSSFAATGLPVQLTTPEVSKKSLSDRLEGLLMRKTEEFYNKLHETPMATNSQSPAATKNGSSPTVVYPNFVNPGLVRPIAVDTTSEITPPPPPPTIAAPASNSALPSTKQSDEELKSPFVPKAPILLADQMDQGGQLINSLIVTNSKAPAELLNEQPQATVSQPMIVSLVIVCSCLIICLVLLMFIVPISVKRLRKRLKHVELQHEHLSQQTSNGSSTVCSSTTSSTRDHLPSLSQFTLGSARSSETGSGGSGSSVCRQSSLDSAKVAMSSPIFGLECSRPLNRINNHGSIANPVYLQQQQQQHHHLHQGPQIIQNQAFLFSGCHQAPNNFVGQPPPPPIGQRCDNVYYPIDDDDFYSTINTGSTILNSSTTDDNQAKQNSYFLSEPTTRGHQPQQESPTMAELRLIESRNSDSGSSTRSLARFLSLPARHSSHAMQSQQQSTTADELQNELTCPVEQIFRQVTSKTIARASHIERDNRNQRNHNHNHTHNDNKHDWELDRHRLKFLDILDAGQFGQVWRCNLRQNRTGDITVAVKTLKNSSIKDERGREELMAEIEIMKLVCNHPNVVKILHCCTSGDSLFGADRDSSSSSSKPILLVMEYVEMGKLQSYLENSRVNHNYATSQQYNSVISSQSTSDRLTSKDLVKFIYHVAKGMEYIASQWIVHRDLASRNILVNSQRICKIGDFGMARHMQSFCGIYERHSRNTKIPVRWMAPEVLLENRFTTKSDVFSFGILMWEIVTLGSTPYRHLKTEQVIEEVARNGERPTKPEYCHAQLYKIMTKCWQHEPDKRPTFGDLVRQLDELLLSANDYIELDQYPDHNYYNIPETSAPNELL